MDENEILGSGAYGTVLFGTLDRNKTVAVKTVSKPVDEMKLSALVAEIKVLDYVGTHPNIVGLMGAQISVLKQGGARKVKIRLSN